jgi:hypothetical protein
MMYPYTKFELNVCNRLRDNERKPIYGMTKGNYMHPAISWRGHKNMSTSFEHGVQTQKVL